MNQISRVTHLGAATAASESAHSVSTRPDSSELVTIGISIGLPEPYATQVQQARRSFGDPQADAIRTHVTLLPPTDVPQSRLEEISAHLQAVAERHRPFVMALAGTDSFRPISPVVFIKVVRGQGDCRRLARAVRTGPLTCELAFAYHPHVTVAHHVDDAALDAAREQMADFRLVFPVGEFQLYTQDAQERWQPVHSYPLNRRRSGRAQADLHTG